MAIRVFQGVEPVLGKEVYVDEFSCVIGRVKIGDESSIWPGVVIRGDVNDVTIGSRTNIQDGSVLHVSTPSKDNPEGYPLAIGNDVTIGHQVMLHGCTIKNKVLVGMSSVVLDGAVIEDEVLVGAGSLVPPGKVLESGFLYLGSPVRQIRKLNQEELNSLAQSATHYINVKNLHLEK
ncbi:gamma carbonic anhydrase family protein [Neisseriaceae bacterium PsAf]|nr:gamma carbonic anhydrase family protein [Neisseriaceae bacterium PsAf]